MLWTVLLACGPVLTATPEHALPEEVHPPPASLVGLTPDDGELILFDRGRTPGVNSGVAISSDGLWAHAGMKGYTCDIWTQDGSIAADLDYPGSGDEVIDGGDDRLLIRTLDGLFVTRFGQHTPSGSLEVEFLADARLVDGGLATLSWEDDGCRVGWYTVPDAPDSETFVDDAWCSGQVSMLAEQDTGTVWLLNDSQLSRVTIQGEAPEGDGGDLLAIDPVWRQAYVANRGEHDLRVFDETGGQRTFVTTGPIQALGSLGQVGGLIIGSPGMVEVLWGEDGTVWGHYEGMVQPDGLMTASDSGAVMGLQEDTAVRFFQGEVF